MNRKQMLADALVLVLIAVIMALALWLLLEPKAEAQGSYLVYPHTEWGPGSAPWHHYAPGHRVRAACFNNYGAHVPCRPVPTYTVWR